MDVIQQYVMAGFVLIGLVNGIGFALDRQWKPFSMFLTAVAAGLVFGFLGWFGLPSAEIGLAVGIGSSGVYKVAQKVGGV
jgi:prepilin signal peptidase PulO-like enzyme (type II secretory pathway)